MIKVSIVIPSYNEEGNIVKLISEIYANIEKDYQLEIIFVDDGSSDNTLIILKELCKRDPNIHFVSFSRNFGHQIALKAGLDYSTGDCVISMDADLQHPPSLINTLLLKWKEGFDIVLTKRLDDENLPFLKRTTSSLFYKWMEKLSEVRIEQGTADFRLIDKKVTALIRQSNELSLFLRGYISWLGFKQFVVSYKPNQRFSGATKYTLNKMLSFAISGVMSFSIKPLRLAIYLGITASIISLCYLSYVLYIGVFTQKAVPGWSSVLASTLVFGSLNLIFLGVIGEYIGKLFMQTKSRPNYIVKEVDENLRLDLDDRGSR